MGEEGIQKRTWKEFRENGLLWYVNSLLHVFGWAIVVECEKDSEIPIAIYPVRTKYRGFSQGVNFGGMYALTKYMKKNADSLIADMKGEDFFDEIKEWERNE